MRPVASCRLPRRKAIIAIFFSRGRKKSLAALREWSYAAGMVSAADFCVWFSEITGQPFAGVDGNYRALVAGDRMRRRRKGFNSRTTPMNAAEAVNMMLAEAGARPSLAVEAVDRLRALVSENTTVWAGDPAAAVVGLPAATQGATLGDTLDAMVTFYATTSPEARAASAAGLERVNATLLLNFDPAWASVGRSWEGRYYSDPFVPAQGLLSGDPTSTNAITPPRMPLRRSITLPLALLVAIGEIIADAPQARPAELPFPDPAVGGGSGEGDPEPLSTPAAGNAKGPDPGRSSPCVEPEAAPATQAPQTQGRRYSGAASPGRDILPLSRAGVDHGSVSILTRGPPPNARPHPVAVSPT